MTMQTYRAELVTREPVSLGLESEIAFRRDIYRYIPGVVLRGALAALWIGRYGEPTGNERERFRRLFEVRIRPGPLRSPGSFVHPLSVSWCKYPGDHDHAARSVIDEAFAGLAGPRRQCELDGCTAPVERGRGDIQFPSGADPVMAITHVPHEPDGTAKQGALHARRYLRPGTEFSGRLVAAPDEFLDEFTDGSDVWLGGRRTVAGRATLTLTPESVPVPDDVAAGKRIAIRLDSAAVFVDPAGRPRFDLAEAELADALGLAEEECEVESRWWRPVTIGGWHAATGVPKPVDRGVAPGSTWVVKVRHAVSGERLAALVRDGLGLRRAEGFGQVHVARRGWTLPYAPPLDERRTERAVAEAARLWRYVPDRAPRRMLSDYLRELAGRPAVAWRDISDAFWRREAGRRLARTGVKDALRPLVEAADPALVRDVRCVLDAAGARGPTPRWLNATLTADPESDGSAR